MEKYHLLGQEKGQRGLNSTEAMLIIHLLDFKWGSKAPFPTVGTLSTRLGICERQVRNTIAGLEALGYLQRVPTGKGRANAYRLEPLFEALERLMDVDLANEEKAA